MRCLRIFSNIVFEVTSSYDKESQLKAVFLLSIIAGLFPVSAQAKYGGGDGTAENPYLIYTAEQMNTIGAEPNDWDKHFKLMADIDLIIYSGEEYNIIGNCTKSFTGDFDGNSHKVLNLTYYSTGEDMVGLFGFVAIPSLVLDRRIRNIGLIDPNIDAGTGDCVGALVGYFFEGTITGCYVQGGSVSGDKRVGGLIGGTIAGGASSEFPLCTQVRNCFATTSVNGTESVGGLIGFFQGYGPPAYQDYYEISKCYSSGRVSGGIGVGGLIGWLSFGGRVFDCYAIGKVSGTEGVGGLVGISAYGIYMPCFTISSDYSSCNLSAVTNVDGLEGQNPMSGLLMRCYSTGNVEGSSNTGGLIGKKYDRVIMDSFWNIEASDQATSDGGIGKMTTEMKKKATFENWDFTEVWNIGEDQTYPFLRYSVAGDLNHDGNVDFADFKIMALHWLENGF
jgi:hypothetical protein